MIPVDPFGGELVAAELHDHHHIDDDSLLRRRQMRQEPRHRLAMREVEVEFVHQVTAGLPTRVMGRLMGLPVEDWDLLHSLAERQTAGQDPDINPPGPDGGETDFSASIDMAMYAIEFAGKRRAEPPREDLTTLILEGDFGGQPMSFATRKNRFI